MREKRKRFKKGRQTSGMEGGEERERERWEEDKTVKIVEIFIFFIRRVIHEWLIYAVIYTPLVCHCC